MIFVNKQRNDGYTAGKNIFNFETNAFTGIVSISHMQIEQMETLHLGGFLREPLNGARDILNVGAIFL